MASVAETREVGGAAPPAGKPGIVAMYVAPLPYPRATRCRRGPRPSRSDWPRTSRSRSATAGCRASFRIVIFVYGYIWRPGDP